MNYKKTLIASIAALAAVGFLAGCGGELPLPNLPLRTKPLPLKSAFPPFPMEKS